MSLFTHTLVVIDLQAVLANLSVNGFLYITGKGQWVENTNREGGGGTFLLFFHSAARL